MYAAACYSVSWLDHYPISDELHEVANIKKELTSSHLIATSSHLIATINVQHQMCMCTAASLSILNSYDKVSYVYISLLLIFTKGAM